MNENKRSRIVLLILLVCAVVVCLIWVVLLYNESHVSEYQPQNVVASDQYEYCLDKVEHSTHSLEVSGWLFEPGEDISIASQQVVIRDSETDEYYLLPSQIQARQDVSDKKGDGKNYTMCGFYAYARSDQFDFDNKEYGIYILYETNGNSNLVDLGISVKDWNNEK